MAINHPVFVPPNQASAGAGFKVGVASAAG